MTWRETSLGPILAILTDWTRGVRTTEGAAAEIVALMRGAKPAPLRVIQGGERGKP